jgi:hypothetical protein
MARVFNAVAAMGICASLAMLGWEVDAQKPSVTRYDFSVVVPPADSDEDDADTPPSQSHNHHGSTNRDQDDDDNGDGDGHPIRHPAPNAAIPA